MPYLSCLARLRPGTLRAAGLALLPLLIALPLAAQAASFDCKQARQADERAICASRALSEQDVEMSVRYEMLMGLVAMGTRGDMGEAQQQWLKRRARCGASQSCLATAYRDRIDALKQQYRQLQSRGPF
ncbi:lysozyme inhibitor LprI family protein [Burkholderia gladioli]|uniref:lysozyme inhibitor LprI family protein n=1 Tax=Burkholderia gladioli TaxID=28095 RepID=UPI0016407990|nr:lysozyme inhibitor LprI family protein [Burkholderia gladioli]